MFAINTLTLQNSQNDGSSLLGDFYSSYPNCKNYYFHRYTLSFNSQFSIITLQMFMYFIGNLNVSICTESICYAKIPKIKYSLRYLQDEPNLYADSISLAMLVNGLA